MGTSGHPSSDRPADKMGHLTAAQPAKVKVTREHRNMGKEAARCCIAARAQDHFDPVSAGWQVLISHAANGRDAEKASINSLFE